MPAQPKRVHNLETVWIHEFAKTYSPTEVGLTYSPQSLRDARLDLIGVRNILRRGHVTFADKLNGLGALWVIEGDNNEGERFHLTAIVITEEFAVDLKKVERVAMEVKAEEINDGHDAV
jgi:hypothetical protein